MIFYPDQAHFAFELLQNAEDTGATEAIFRLCKDGCWFEHDGKRTFTETDIRADKHTFRAFAPRVIFSLCPIAYDVLYQGFQKHHH